MVGIRSVLSPFEQRPLELHGNLRDGNGRKLNQHLQQVGPHTVLGRLVVDVTWGNQNRGVCEWRMYEQSTQRDSRATDARPPAVTHWVCCPFLYWWWWACGCRGAGTRVPTPAAAPGKTCKGGCCTSACGFRPCAARNQPRNARRAVGDAAGHLQEERS